MSSRCRCLYMHVRGMHMGYHQPWSLYTHCAVAFKVVLKCIPGLGAYLLKKPSA